MPLISSLHVATQSHIHQVEMIQRRAARFVYNDFSRLRYFHFYTNLIGHPSNYKQRSVLLDKDYPQPGS